MLGPGREAQKRVRVRTVQDSFGGAIIIWHKAATCMDDARLTIAYTLRSH